jgi:hypothetical protein
MSPAGDAHAMQKWHRPHGLPLSCTPELIGQHARRNGSRIDRGEGNARHGGDRIECPVAFAR